MSRPIFEEFVKRVNGNDYVFKSVAVDPFDRDDDENYIKEGKFIEDSYQEVINQVHNEPDPLQQIIDETREEL